MGMTAGRRLLAFGALAALVASGCTAPEPPTPSPVADAGWSERGPVSLAVGSGEGERFTRVVADWNEAHPNEPVTVVELPTRDGQRAPDLAGRAQAGSGEYTVELLEPAATAEFAANGWLATLPAAAFPTDGLAPAAVASATHEGELAAYPVLLDAGVLYYRTDLLDRLDAPPPTTWTQLRAACSRLMARGPSRWCYAGQLGPHPDLTSNLAEAIWSGGGSLVTADGTPSVNTPAAAAGLSWLAADVSSGATPEAALTWSGDGARRAFASGSLVFLRDWWSAGASIEAGASAVVGTGSAPLPGRDGEGVAVLGGRNLGISAQARNKGTAGEFVRYLASPPVQRELVLEGAGGPVLTELATDAALLKEVPRLKTLNAVLATARPLPVTTKYRQFTKDVQETCLPALRGERAPADALADLEERMGRTFG